MTHHQSVIPQLCVTDAQYSPGFAGGQRHQLETDQTAFLLRHADDFNVGGALFFIVGDGNRLRFATCAADWEA